MTTKTNIVSIAAAVAAIALCIAVAVPLVGINIAANNQEQLPNNTTEAFQMGGEHLSGRLEVLGYEQGTPVLIPEEEQLTTLPQSFAPTSNYVEEGEVVYTGWKVVRDDPVVEEPEVEEPEEPVTPQKPTKPGCYHGYMNPAFCPVCWLNTPHLPGFGSMPGC